MDATVGQIDGFHFMYVLPFGERRVLMEDTFFSNDARLDRSACRERIEEYLDTRGLRVRRVLREEEGVLPMPWRGAVEPATRGPLVAGYRGGFFHPATGYSLPVAARFAESVASCAPAELFTGCLTRFVRAHARQAAFCHRLNAMLFQWFPPNERWHVFERFYGLPVETIERFYAMKMRTIDRGRLLVGRPPRGMSIRYRLRQGVHA